MFHNLFSRKVTALDVLASFPGISGFLRLVVFIQDAVDKTLAVANHPYLAVIVGIDGCTACESSFGILFYDGWINVEMLIGHRYGIGDDVAKFRAADFRWQTGYGLSDQLHTIAPVTFGGVYSDGCFAGAAVYHGHVGGRHYDSVLACLLALLANELLFDYFRHTVF